MRKALIPLLVMLALMLGACGNSAKTAQTPTGSSEPPQSASKPSESSVVSQVPSSAAEKPPVDAGISVPEEASEDVDMTPPAEDEGESVPESSVADPPAEESKADSEVVAPPSSTETPKPASSSASSTSAPEPTPVSKPESAASQTQASRQYDVSDPNIKKYQIYATAKTAAEFKAGMEKLGKLNWRSAAETIAIQKNEDPDYMIDGQTFYDWRMKPIQEWVDAYVSDNGLSYKNKTDYKKTEIIKHVIENERLEEFIGLWRPGFRFTTNDCVPIAEGVNFLMIAMGFELIEVVGSDTHAFNAYWDSTAKAIRFIDGGSIVATWNVFVDELDEIGHILD